MAIYKRYDVVPVPAPRMTRADRRPPVRPPVQRYRDFEDALKKTNIRIPESGCHIVFVLPMPPSWKKEKRAAHLHQPHTNKPDIDNLEKALLDVVFKHNAGGDQHVWDARVSKIWGERGAVLVGEVEAPEMADIIYALTQEQLELTEQDEQLTLEG